MALLGRRAEREALDRLVADAAAGRSHAAILRGEAGVGKSALLDDLARRTSGWHVVAAAGVEAEAELAYAGLHQLCAPMLDSLDRLPAPQRDALATVFGRSAKAAPDRFLVGLATLTLLAEVAEEQPLLCLVDDAQWLDDASALVIGFVARRLLAERIAIVCASRDGVGDDALAGLPEIPVLGLADGDARALLLQHVHGPLDVAVCDQIVAESRGNPLALLELPRAWNPAALAGGFGLPGSQPTPGKIEESYVRRLRQLSADTQLLLLVAAAEPLGDPVLIDRAAGMLGLDLAAAGPAIEAGLLTVGARVEFAHPLVRSAAYRSASPEDRHRVHGALGEATDADRAPERRAWHRARAAPGPGEEIALELERAAGRAQARAGVAAAAAFLQRAASLTDDPVRRAERALAAAQASQHAGSFDAALGLVATAESGTLDALQHSRVSLLRGRIAFASGRVSAAPALLLEAARRLEPFDPELARETYLTAWCAACVAGRRKGGDVLRETCAAIQALPPRAGAPRPLDLLLDGLALLTTGGHAVAAPALERAAAALIEIPVEDVLSWGWMATAAGNAVWDNDGARAISARNVQLVRDVGALAELPLHLSALGLANAWTGDFAGADANIAEADSVAEAIASRFASWALLRLRALQGNEAEAAPAIARAIELAADGQSVVNYAHWAGAVLYNGLGRYAEAAASARQATADAYEPWSYMWTLPELVEAAARTGDAELARDALERLATTTQPSGNECALGLEARCRALVSDGLAADDAYREAIERLSRTELRPELARAHLLYGEWLRRADRRADAREQLRTAYDMLEAIGMVAFAVRARDELVAAGEKVRKRGTAARDGLTPQEEQIARLARDGLSNPEIGAQLFISARTVEWHLSKVFAKLGIDARGELRSALPRSDHEAAAS